MCPYFFESFLACGKRLNIYVYIFPKAELWVVNCFTKLCLCIGSNNRTGTDEGWSRATVLRVSKFGPGTPGLPSGNPQGEAILHNYTKSLFALSTFLTFALKLQEHWWVKLVLERESSQWHQLVHVVILLFTVTQSQKKKAVPIKNILDVAVKRISFMKSWSSNACLFSIWVIKWNTHKAHLFLKVLS